VIWGAGPVGLMAAMSARVRGADRVFVVDRQADRLKLAEALDATPVDDSAGDAVQQILDATRGEGADRGVEAVGYQAHDHRGKEQPGLTINSLIRAVRPAGRIGVVGVFVPEDPSAADAPAKEGKFAFDFGTFFFKGQSMGTGQANVKQYNRRLRNLIHRDRISPGVIVSHELNLDQAPEGCRHFDDREDGWTKILLHP
jgi:glutathione-independent formaldehyde dehydrogenase